MRGIKWTLSVSDDCKSMIRYIRVRSLVLTLRLLPVILLVAGALARVTDAQDVAKTFEFPLHQGSYNLSQSFGVWNQAFGGYHLGEDYVISNGDELPVYAPANGVVKHNAKRTRYGYVVIIEHSTEDPDTKACSVLGHLRASGIISVGSQVLKGQLVGFLSSSYAENGNYNFTHLHFGIRHGSYSSAWVYEGYGSEEDRKQWWSPTNFLAMHREEHISWNFCNNGDTDLGWKVQHGAAGACQNNSWIIDPDNGLAKDPAIQSPEYDTYNSLYINPTYYDHAQIYMSSNLDNRTAKLYWTSSNHPSPPEEQSQSFNLKPAVGGWASYCVDLSNNPKWLHNGRIQWLRLDFSETGDASGVDVCAVDYIRLLHGPCPTAKRPVMSWLNLLLEEEPPVGACKTIRVPSDFSTIQAAIDAASNCDTVLVADGTYIGKGNKNLDFRAKKITVRSENGPVNCIIDCQNDGRGFYFHSGETSASIISGLTIKNGNTNGIGVAYPEGCGGGILCVGSSPRILNSVIRSNSAYWGGGIYSDGTSNIVVEDCSVLNNTATDAFGGGMFISGKSIVLDSLIDGNMSGYNGGGITTHPFNTSDTHPVISRCIISNNVACIPGDQYCGGRGGGIGVYHANTSISNCLITDNTAYLGSAIVIENDGLVEVTNCTISRNKFSGFDYGVLCEIGRSSSMQITNTIVWGNKQTLTYPPGTYVISYSNVEGGWEGVGNINVDPQFVQPDSGNFRLSPGSSCIDAGSATNAPLIDLDGIARPQGNGFDMGAYEYD